jgi:hypothetical protein
VARAERLIVNRDCVERGYLLLTVVGRNQVSGDFDAAGVVAAEAVAIADRFHDADLGAFARALQGHMLLRLGQVERGLALVDEAMVAVTSGDLNPVLTGLIYCISIAGCSQVYVLDRAREWTAALATWCEAQPDLVPFHGTCLVHRAELMQFGGAWREAIEEAERASTRVAATVDPETAADSLYQQGQVHRLRGDFEAERARLSRRQPIRPTGAARARAVAPGAGTFRGRCNRPASGPSRDQPPAASRAPAADVH